MVDVREKGQALKNYPFVSDWWKMLDYDEHNERIHNGSTFWQRLKDGVSWLWYRSPGARALGLNKPFLLWRFGMLWFSLRNKYEHPDAAIEDKVLAYWGEDAEYLTLVQPLVGDVIGDFLIEEPDHPHAINIAKAIQKAEDNR